MSVSSRTSFKYLCTVTSIVYPTFQAAYIAIGLLEDDYKQINCLIEACIFTAGTQLYSLFVTTLLYSPVAELVALWDRFKQSICDNLSHFLAQQPNVPFTVSKDDNAHLNYSLYLIYQILADQQKTLTDYGLPQFQHQWGVIAERGNPLLAAELQQYDCIEEEQQFTELH